MNEQIEKSLNRLKSIVLNDAHEQSERAAQEFENKTNNIIEKKGSEYAVSTEKRKKSAIAKTEREARASVLNAELSARAELSSYREKLVDSIFDGVSEKLSEYMKTEEYTVFLLEKAGKALSECGEGKKILEANAADCPKLKQLGTDVRECEIFGGVRAVNADKGIICDYSFDDMLAEARGTFLRKSGLKIEI
mgnify:CR=1 FL=1